MTKQNPPFWIIFFNTLSKFLIFLFLLSLIIIFILSLWLFNIPAPFKFMEVCGNVIFDIAVSYIAAFIFFLITVHYKETKSNIAIYSAAKNPVEAIITNILNIFIDMGKKLGEDYQRENLNPELVKSLLNKTKCFSESTMNSTISKTMNWLEYIDSRQRVITDWFSKLYPLYPKMEGKLIARLSHVERKIDFYPMKKMIFLSIETKLIEKDKCCFNEGLEEFFFIPLFEDTIRLNEEFNKLAKIYHLK